MIISIISISLAKFTFSFHSSKLFLNDLMPMEDFRFFLDDIFIGRVK